MAEGRADMDEGRWRVRAAEEREGERSGRERVEGEGDQLHWRSGGGSSGGGSGSNTSLDTFTERERRQRELQLGLHPLQHRYVVWYTRRSKYPGGSIATSPAAAAAAGGGTAAGAGNIAAGSHRAAASTSYESNIRRIAEFSTVESFWSCYCHMARVPTLPVPTDLHVFREGIRPLWEDGSNKRGGKWIVRLRKGLAARFWEELLMAVVGEQMEGSDGICGAVLSVRFSEDIISVWNRDAQEQSVRDTLRESIRKCLHLPPTYTMEYKPHDASLKDLSSYRNTWIRA